LDFQHRRFPDRKQASRFAGGLRKQIGEVARRLNYSAHLA